MEVKFELKPYLTKRKTKWTPKRKHYRVEDVLITVINNETVPYYFEVQCQCGELTCVTFNVKHKVEDVL